MLGAYIPCKILMEDNGTTSGTQKFQMSETFCALVGRFRDPRRILHVDAATYF